MTEMENKLRTAGVDVDKSRLAEAAYSALRRCRMSEERALARFVAALREDQKLLMALAGPYLSDRARDMQGPREGASQLNTESQQSRDRPSPALASSRPSQNVEERQVTVDRPTAPSLRNDASQHVLESPHACDRVVPSRKIGKAGAVAAIRSVYDMHIGMEITFRTATLYDIINAERAGTRYARVMTLLRTRKQWPEEPVAVPKVYSERELKAILAEADQSLPPLPTEALSHVR